MKNSKPGLSQKLDKNPNPLTKAFKKLEQWVYLHPLSILLVSLLFAGFCLWFTTQHLKFKTSRKDLIAQDLPFHVLYKKYRKEFKDFDGMIVVIEGSKQEVMKDFAEKLVVQLNKKQEIFSQIYFKVDTDYFKSKSLLYLTQEELGQLRKNLIDHEEFLFKLNESPGLNTLLQSINEEISVGVVDTLMTDFLGSEDESSEENEEDLSLLINLLNQMNNQLKGEEAYKSPWGELFSIKADDLESQGYLVSDDQKLLFILLNPKETSGDFAGAKQAIDGIREIINDTKKNFSEIRVGLTGGEVIASDEMFTTHRDAKRASLYALIGVALLFIGFYRGLVQPLLAVITLLICIAIALGYTTLIVGHLNIISVVFTTILIGLGIDFGIHILCRYREERQLGQKVSEALSNTLQKTGVGNLAGAVTTAIAFGAMAFTNFVGIIELGIIAFGGIMICFVGMIIVLPALIVLHERWGNPVYQPVQKIYEKEMLFEKWFSRYGLIILTTLLLLFWASWVSKDIRFDYNLLHMQAKGIEAVDYEMKIIKNAKRASWNAAMIASSLEEAKGKFQKLQRSPTVGRVETILTALPDKQEEKVKKIAEIAPQIEDLNVNSNDEVFSLKRLNATLKKLRFKLRKKEKESHSDEVFEASQKLKTLQQTLSEVEPAVANSKLQNFSKHLFNDYRTKMGDLKKSSNPTPVKIDEFPQDLKSRFISKTGKYLLLIYPKINIWERESMERFLNEMQLIDPNVTGNAVHMYNSSRLMIEGYIRSGIYAFSVIFIYLLITFRKLKTTLLVLLPSIAGAIFTLGLMDLFNIQFNLANLVILPLILGIGVVDGVHIMHRYKEEIDSGANVISKSTGQAVLLTSLTTMIGFGSLMIADHQGVFSLGAVLTLGVGSCLFTSVTLLPALMKLGWERGWQF